MTVKSVIFASCVAGIGVCSPIYVTDGTNSDPPGTVYSISSSNAATATVSNSLSPPFSRPLGVALSPEGTFAYVSDWDTGELYYIDVPTNTATQIVSGGYLGPNGVAISSDSAFAYVAGYNAGGVFYVDVATNTATPTTNTFESFGGPVVPAISLDASFVYVTDIGSAAVYRIDPVANAVTAVVTGSFQYPVGIVIANDGTKAYVADPNATALFIIDTQSNVATKFESGLFQTPQSVAISPDGQIVYIADAGTQAIFYYDTASQQIVQQVDVAFTGPDWAIPQIAISPDGSSLYLAGANDSTIWHIDTASGTTALVPNDTATPYKSPTSVATTPSLILTQNLSGNNLTVANYLNANQPYIALRNTVPLQGSELNRALEMISPARNAFATFGSQIAQIALGRLVNDHQRQYRWKKSETANQPIAMDDTLLTANDISGFSERKVVVGPKRTKKNRSLWLGAFGEYAHEKAQHQTPAFEAGSGGAVLAWDWSGTYPSPIGVGAAYAYTHIHEKDGFGQANVMQGDLFLYATFPVSDWYFDGALWGGYYHINNVRKITYPGVAMSAALSTHGWQFTPHFEVGYDYRSNAFGVEPFALVDWVNCWEAKAAESGALNYNMGQKGRYCSLLRAEAGIRFKEFSAFDWGTIAVMEKASYAYQKTFHTGEINAFLVGAADSFLVSTLIGAQNLGVAEIEVFIDPSNQRYPYASLSGHIELGTQYQSYQGMIEIGKKF